MRKDPGQGPFAIFVRRLSALSERALDRSAQDKILTLAAALSDELTSDL